MGKAYVPTREEFTAELLRMAERFHGGRFAPGKSKWDNVRPKGWTMANRLIVVYQGDTTALPNWADTVKMLTGLEIAPHKLPKREKPLIVGERPYPRVDDNKHHGGGLPYTRVRSVGNRNYYMVR